jgi:hypothetical protein
VSVVFLAPGLMPGKTLSNSDVLWFSPPFVAEKPAELQTPSNPELGDATTQLQLFLHHTERNLPHVPLWAPYIAGGRPFHANSQSAVFGPYSWPAYVLPFWTALGWIGVLKLWVAAFGTYLLGRALGMRFGGALVAGLVFALSLKMVTWISYPHMSVWTFIPWLLLLTEHLVRRRTLLAGAGLAAVVALVLLSGHPESSFHALLATGLFLLLRLWQARREDLSAAQPAWRTLLAFGGAALAGAALAAISLIPFLELLLHSADLRDRSGESIDVALDLKEGIGIFLPDWWGRPTQTPIRLFVIERALYIGALPLMLVAAALVLRPRAERIAIAVFGLVVLAVVLGIPPFLQVVTRLPIFSSGHNTRLVILAVFAAALLAGWGFDDLTEGRRAPRHKRRILLGVAAALVAVPLLLVAALEPPALDGLREGFRIAWLFADPPGEFRYQIGEDAIRMSAIVLWVTLAGGGLVLVALRLRGRLKAAHFAVLAVLLVLVDLFRAGMGFNPAIDQEHAEVRATGAVRYLQRQGADRFTGTMEIPQNVLPFEFGLYEARGYDLPILQRYDRLWRRDVAPESRSVAAGIADVALELRNVTPRSLRVLRRLGITHVLRAKSVLAAPPERGLVPYPPLDTPGLELAYDGPDARVYRVNGALPRAFVVGAQRVVEDDEAARKAFVDPAVDLRRVGITEERLPGLPVAGQGAARAGSALITRYEPEHVVVRARSRGPGLLVLGDNWFPGWKAEVDGREAPVERVDYLLRGVPLGPGSHRVELRYEPASWRIGWITSAVSLAALLLVVLVAWRRRRRDAAAEPETVAAVAGIG